MDERSMTERGWRLAALLLLGVVAFFWMPLGVRDASGVSSVIPALRPASQSRPDRPDRPAATRPLAARRTVVAARAAAVLVRPVLVLAVVLLGVAATTLVGRPRPPSLGRLRARGPPVVL